jgi:large subunit ribosomal protein L49
MGNLPVYTDIRKGNTLKVTIVRKVAGDAIALGRELERLCKKPVKLYHGRVEVKGFHKSKVEEYLSSLGF